MKDEKVRRGGLPEVPFGSVVGGEFMVQRPLKKGAMGAVYVAEQLSTGSLRALKVLRREYVADETLFKRFEREAQVASKIRSEHVAQVIAAGVDARLDVPWIALELLEGQSLSDHLAETGPIPKDLVRSWLEQLCHALAAAHKIGIVHRDLKPANVFLSEARRVGSSRVVKVLDFGIAKIVAESFTMQGESLGTPSWMAPEQALGQAILPAADVWSLGLLAFTMLTGRSFWKNAARDDAKLALMQEIVKDPIPIAWARAIEVGAAGLVPDGFSEWFAQCVAREPKDRFVNAAGAYAALASALA